MFPAKLARHLSSGAFAHGALTGFVARGLYTMLAIVGTQLYFGRFIIGTGAAIFCYCKTGRAGPGRFVLPGGFNSIGALLAEPGESRHQKGKGEKYLFHVLLFYQR